MVKILVGITGLALLVAGAFGFAAPLTVDGGVLQAGADNTLTCDDAVTISWNNVTNNATTSNWQVGTVNVNGINSACDGYDMTIMLTGVSGNYLSDCFVNDLDDTTNKSCSFLAEDGAPIDPMSVYDVHVLIQSD